MAADGSTFPTPNVRPGERLFRGEVVVFDLDLLNRHVAREAVENCPADLTVLSDGEVEGLSYSCIRRAHEVGPGMDPVLDETHARVCAERARRGFDTRGVGVAS